jgi:pimeloyl-ACP methyl ester carboxylesterase
VPDSKTVVLVHGAWHGAWCWDKVVALLTEQGVAVETFDLPMTSYEDDVATTKAVLDRVDGEVVLCGHSYGGAVITNAGHHPKVAHLVYLTAFACDADESPSATAPEANLPATDLAAALVIDDDGNATITPELVVATFYHDCDPADAEDAVRRLRPAHMSCFVTPVGPPAWKDTPSTYVVCTEARASHPALHRHMAARCNSTIDLDTAHSPFLNRPDAVAELLARQAT